VKGSDGKVQRRASYGNDPRGTRMLAGMIYNGCRVRLGGRALGLLMQTVIRRAAAPVEGLPP
jgi:hypothetical protein